MFGYEWRIADGYSAPGAAAHGSTAFSTFCSGGGSTMGMRLAGYDVLGGVEIDPRAAGAYRANNKPALLYVEDIRAFNERDDLPDALYGLDLLDGSPPCTSFSFSGRRELDWGRARRFAEGGAEQVLDDLVLAYCDTVAKLQPKAAVMENVPGLAAGNAAAYLARALARLGAAGYDAQLFRLNAALMGVPQSRERLFVIARRRGLGWPPLRLSFSERPIPFGEVMDAADTHEDMQPAVRRYWELRRPGDRSIMHIARRVEGSGSFFNHKLLTRDRVASTVTSSSDNWLFDVPRRLNVGELVKVSSFPADYDWCGMRPLYLTGMSVPPVMAAQVAWQVYEQWLAG